MRHGSHDGQEKEGIATSSELFVHACVRACMPVRVDIHVCLNLGVHCHSARVEGRTVSGVSPLLPPCLRQGLSLVCCSAQQASWPSCFLGFACLCLLSLRGSAEGVDALSFTWALEIRTQVPTLT